MLIPTTKEKDKEKARINENEKGKEVIVGPKDMHIDESAKQKH